ncbi:MAG: cupredoxin domain-containing protein, partial [Thermocrispum sp.]
IYWHHRKHRLPGGPPTSWDLSMTVTGLPYWGIKLKPEDSLRISATYDTTHQASYEDMGIAIGLIAPSRADGTRTAPGLNPFKAPRERSKECRSLRKRIRGPASDLQGFGLDARRPKLCVRGLPTHGHQAANGNYGYASGDWDAPPGSPTQSVNILNFQYGPGDLSTASTRGVPQVPLGSNLQFNNLEGALILHTVTTCRFPCKGPTGAANPIADGQTSTGRAVDLDSSEMGLGVPAIGPATNRLSWRTPVTREAGYEPGEVVTYFCRIHPFMRGAFQVSEG